jgi:hypothetical protein
LEEDDGKHDLPKKTFTQQNVQKKTRKVQCTYCLICLNFETNVEQACAPLQSHNKSYHHCCTNHVPSTTLANLQKG